MSEWDEVRCVAFDFDGTLADSNAVKRGCFFEIFADWPGSAEVVARVLRENPVLDRHGVVPLIRSALCAMDPERAVRSLPAEDELVAAYGERTEREVAACPAVPGALEALVRLEHSYPLYVVSATPEDALQRVVARRGWSRHFRGVLGRPADKVENLRLIARREELSSRAILLVGDDARDADAARAFGAHFAGRGTSERARLALRRHPLLGALEPLVREISERAG